MDDYALVLNAGSSSLKFCVYRRRRRTSVAARGARPDRGHRHVAALRPRRTAPARSSPTSALRRDGRATAARRSTALAGWLRAHYRRRARARRRPSRRPRRRALCRPRDRHAAGARRSAHARPARAAAPAAQPRRDRGGRPSGCRDVPQVACFDTSFHRGQPAVAELVPLPREIRDGGVQRYGFHGLSYEYIASVLPQVAPEIADGRVIVAHLGSGASLCALKQRQERRQHARLHGARRPLHGHAARRARSRRRPVPVPDPRDCRPRRSRRCSTRSRACSASPASATTCATCSAAPSRRRGWPSTTSSTARPRRSARWPRCSAASTALVFTAGIGENSAEIRRRICEASAWLGHRARRAGERARTDRASRAAAAACRPG